MLSWIKERKRLLKISHFLFLTNLPAPCLLPQRGGGKAERVPRNKGLISEAGGQRPHADQPLRWACMGGADAGGRAGLVASRAKAQEILKTQANLIQDAEGALI